MFKNPTPTRFQAKFGLCRLFVLVCFVATGLDCIDAVRFTTGIEPLTLAAIRPLNSFAKVHPPHCGLRINGQKKINFFVLW